MRVNVVNAVRCFDVAPGQALLDAALKASWNLPHRCKGGHCGLCKGRLLRGDITYPNGRPLGLSDAEAAAGYVLLCQAMASSDLELELHDVRSADQAGLLRLTCRIERAIPVAQDVMCVLLRRPPAVDFAFKAGQYVDVSSARGSSRSFSIASPPHDSSLLELHVRRVPGGEFSEWLFGKNVANELVTIEGPKGQFFFRDAPPSARPLLMVGGGTGIAPLLSILRHIIEKHVPRRMTLYWGVRGPRDFYASATLDGLLSLAPNLRYVPVVSQPEAGWRGRTGFVHGAVLEDLNDLSEYDIYAAGPPPMIEALQLSFLARGAQVNHLYCDSFDFQRTSAATRS